MVESEAGVDVVTAHGTTRICDLQYRTCSSTYLSKCQMVREHHCFGPRRSRGNTGRARLQVSVSTRRAASPYRSQVRTLLAFKDVRLLTKGALRGIVWVDSLNICLGKPMVELRRVCAGDGEDACILHYRTICTHWHLTSRNGKALCCISRLPNRTSCPGRCCDNFGRPRAPRCHRGCRACHLARW